MNMCVDLFSSIKIDCKKKKKIRVERLFASVQKSFRRWENTKERKLSVDPIGCKHVHVHKDK